MSDKEFNNLKDVTIKKVGKFTVIENHKPVKPQRRCGDPNDPIPPIYGGPNDTVPPIKVGSNDPVIPPIEGGPNDPDVP